MPCSFLYSSQFIFRRPLLSTVSNIFVLPFQRNVWLAIVVFNVAVFCLLYWSIKWEYQRDVNSTASATYWHQLNPIQPTISDNIFILLGAFAQQGKPDHRVWHLFFFYYTLFAGYMYEAYRVPSRIITLTLLLASMSLYAAYTANIVALLQSTTDSIRTLPDLLASPFKLGAQDIVYNRHYFKVHSRNVISKRKQTDSKSRRWERIIG